MNFIADSGELLKHLQNIGGVLNSSNTLPILDNFLFEIEDGELTISASDIETTMKTVMEIKAEENGRIAIPARLLLDILKTFNAHPLNFSVDPEKFTVDISSDYGRYKLVGQNADDFPKSPKPDGAKSVTVNCDILQSAINKTLFATSTDELRPVMCGVLCEFSESDITFVATDAHKLVRYRRKDYNADGASSFIIPKKPLLLLKSNLSTEGEAKVEYNETNAIFTFDNVELTCRLIDGKYPNYEAVIPLENPNQMTIDRVQFLNSIKRVSIFANKMTHQVKFKMAGSELTISAEDVDFYNEANERLTCSYEGTDMEIGFNSRFLLEMLNNIVTPEVRLEMSEPNRAGLILPVDGENKDEEILMLVMPVTINR